MMNLAQAEGHMELVQELINEVAEDLRKVAAEIIDSGDVALGKYDNQEYYLAKLILTAALYTVKDNYADSHNPDFFREFHRLSR